MNYLNKYYDRYRYESYLFLLSVLVFIIHVHLASTLNLGNDEAHYYVWSLKQSLGYLDDAPLVSYIIYFFTAIFGKSELAVRLGAVIFSFLDGFLIYHLTYILFKSKRASFFAFLFYLSALIFGMVISVMALPDASLLFFYLCFLIIFYTTLEYGNKNEDNNFKVKKLLLWILTGLFLGLAFLSKYTAALIPPVILLYLLISKKNRGILKTLYPYVALIAALFVFSPVIYWNFAHNLVSFKFQLSHGFSSPKPGMILFAQGWLGQFFVITPLVYMFLIWTFGYSLKLIISEKVAKLNSYTLFDNIESLLYAVCFSLPILVFFILNGYSHKTLVHWPDIGYLSAFPLMGYLADKISRNKNVDRSTQVSAINKASGIYKFIVYFTIFSGLFLSFVLYNQIYYNSIPVGKIIRYIDKEKNLKQGGIFTLIPYIPGKPKTADITNDLFGWRNGAKYIGIIFKGYKKAYAPLFILTHHYAIADELVYYGDYKPDSDIFNIAGFLNQYDLWQNLNKINGENAIFIMDNKYMINPMNTYKGDFKSIKKIGRLYIYNKLRTVRIYYLYLMKDFNAKKALKRLRTVRRMY